MIITRKGNFDAAHRIMDHGGRCFNLHGHTYLYEIQLHTTVGNIGYGIDFADVKSIIQYYIDGYLDHGAILNPADTDIIKLCQNMSSKYHVMHDVTGNNVYMNPSAENIAREMFYTLHAIFIKLNVKSYIGINNIRLYETPNCYVDYSTFNNNLFENFSNSKTIQNIINNV